MRRREGEPALATDTRFDFALGNTECRALSFCLKGQGKRSGGALKGSSEVLTREGGTASNPLNT